MSGRAVLLALLLGLLAGFLGTAKYKDATWGAELSSLQSSLDRQLKAETERVLEAERRGKSLNDLLEQNHAKASKHINGLLAENLRLANELGGLRDPGTTFRPTAQGAAEPAAVAAGSSTSRGLSVEAEEFLLAEAHRADEVAEYAHMCYQWVNDPSGGTAR